MNQEQAAANAHPLEIVRGSRVNSIEANEVLLQWELRQAQLAEYRLLQTQAEQWK
jgi:hypothetical protein